MSGIYATFLKKSGAKNFSKEKVFGVIFKIIALIDCFAVNERISVYYAIGVSASILAAQTSTLAVGTASLFSKSEWG